MRKAKEEKRVNEELIDRLLERQGHSAEDVHGLLKQLTKALVERAMQAEMNEHLGYTKHDPAGTTAGTAGMGSRERS